MFPHSLRLARPSLVAVGLVAVSVVAASAQTPADATRLVSISRHVDFTTDAETPFDATARTLAPRVAPRFSAASATTAQNAADSGVAFGVLGMITRTSWRTDGVGEFFDPGNRTGWGAGLWVGGNRNGRVGFVGEFIYLQRGDDDFKTTALQIPAVFHINFGSRSRTSAGGYVVVGPSFTINLKNELFGVDISDDFQGADIGIIGGVGVEFFRVGIEGRGNWGVRNIDRSGDVDDLKTFTFELVGKFAFN